MPALSSLGRLMAHNVGGTALLGGGLGAGLSAAAESRKAEGDRNYLSAITRGGLRGAALGAASGGIARAVNDTRLLNPGLQGASGIAKATAARMGEGVSNFAKRQLHGLTGYGSKTPGHLDQIGVMGNAQAARRAALVEARAKDMGDLIPSRRKNILEGAAKQIEGIREEGAIGQKMQEAGLTSLPGVVKGLTTNPREAAKALWSHARQGGKAGVALGVGLPAAMAAGDLAKGDESATGGRTIGGKLLSHGTNIGTGFAFAGLPMVSQMVAGMGTDAITNRITRRSPLPAPQQMG